MKDVLARISSDRMLDASWLNTLSVLEFIGARKISKTVAESHPTLEVLEHLHDEVGHAMLFKRLSVERAEDDAFSGYLALNEAVQYFQTLDATVAEALGTSRAFSNYLVTTMLIERRAMALYPLYRSVSEAPSIRDVLRRVIVEEASHRDTIEQRAFAALEEAGVDAEALLREEERLFGQLLGVLAEASASVARD